MKNNCNVMVYIKNTVNFEEFQQLRAFLNQCTGVLDTVMGKTKANLFMVKYNPSKIRSGDIVSALYDQGFEARLIGF